MSAPRRRGVRFAARITSNKAPSKQPLPPLAELEDELLRNTQLAIEGTTRYKYNLALRQWETFTKTYKLAFVPTPHSLALFVTWRLRVATSVLATLLGLAYHFKPTLGKEWTSVHSSAEVLRAIRGGMKFRAHRVKRAAPLPYLNFERFITLGLAKPSSYDDLLFAAMLTIGFFCCGRLGEMVDPDNTKFVNPKKRLRRETTTCTATAFRSYLSYAKNDPLYNGAYYFFVAEATRPLFLVVVQRYLDSRDEAYDKTGDLFIRANGNVPTRSWFIRRLRRAFGRQFGGHSLRPAGITYYVLRGMQDSPAMRQGRWKSESWRQYVRCSPELELAMAIRDGRSLIPHHVLDSILQPLH